MYGHCAFPLRGPIPANKALRQLLQKAPSEAGPGELPSGGEHYRHTSPKTAGRVCQADENTESSGYGETSKTTFAGIAAREGLHGSEICIREIGRLP